MNPKDLLMMKSPAITAAFAALLALTIPFAQAQDGKRPSAEEIIRKLLEPPEIRPDDLKSNAVQVEGRRRRAQPDQNARPSIDLAVNFEYASSKLTPDARLVLDNLAKALADPALSGSRFEVAGHTDARGSDAYNLVLSKQRARAAADYLVREHGIDAKRLTVEGFGERQLLDPANPESAVNRRVQITNLGQ